MVGCSVGQACSLFHTAPGAGYRRASPRRMTSLAECAPTLEAQALHHFSVESDRAGGPGTHDRIVSSVAIAGALFLQRPRGHRSRRPCHLRKRQARQRGRSHMHAEVNCMHAWGLGDPDPSALPLRAPQWLASGAWRTLGGGGEALR